MFLCDATSVSHYASYTETETLLGEDAKQIFLQTVVEETGFGRVSFILVKETRIPVHHCVEFPENCYQRVCFLSSEPL